MAIDADVGDGADRKSARSKRKEKEKANKRKRVAAGNVVNPYAATENEEDDKDEGEANEVEPVEDVKGKDTISADDGRPKTSYSDASGDTLVGTPTTTAAPSASTPPPTARYSADATDAKPKSGDDGPAPGTTSRTWTYDDLPTTPEGYIVPQDGEPESPDDEPPTEAEIRHKEIDDWLAAQKGHAWNYKQATRERMVDFVYEMLYQQDREEWMKEMRLIVWRAVVRANFWWKNPDTGEPTGKPEPIAAPTGVYESNFNLFVTCAAERLDRIGRDLPDPEHVAKTEAAVRLFLARVAAKPAALTRSFEHLAFLLLVDEEHGRAVTVAEMQTRLRMCFDGVKKGEMEWKGLGVLVMGEWATRKGEVPLRTEVVWDAMVKRFGL